MASGSRWRSGPAVAVLLAVAATGCTKRAATTPPSGSATSSSASQAAMFPAPPTNPLPSATGTALQAVLDKIVADNASLPDTTTAAGLTAAVVSDRGIWAGAAGQDGVGTRLRPETVLAIAGITNTFTAAEVMHLVATGQVKLDDPMSAYVKHPLTANGATVRETLSMRSGLSDPAEGTFDKPFLAQPHRHWTMTETLSYTPKSSRAPGGMSEYADTNFLLLGLLIEAVSHTSAAAALRADLIDPAGLTRTAVQDAERPVPPVAVPKHDEVPATFDGYVPLHSAVSALVTAGGIAADAADVARWGYSLYGGLLLEPGLVAQMTQPLATQPNTPYAAYGLGTMQFSEALGPDSLGHTGQAPGFSSLLVVVPERREAVAVLITDSNTGPFSVARKLVAALGT
jgi:D-alanyl-D-alanine carboxypeptidase